MDPILLVLLLFVEVGDGLQILIAGGSLPCALLAALDGAFLLELLHGVRVQRKFGPFQIGPTIEAVLRFGLLGILGEVNLEARVISLEFKIVYFSVNAEENDVLVVGAAVFGPASLTLLVRLAAFSLDAQAPRLPLLLDQLLTLPLHRKASSLGRLLKGRASHAELRRLLTSLRTFLAICRTQVRPHPSGQVLGQAIADRLLFHHGLDDLFGQDVHLSHRLWLEALQRAGLDHALPRRLLLTEEKEIVFEFVDDLLILHVGLLELPRVVNAARVIDECDLLLLPQGLLNRTILFAASVGGALDVLDFAGGARRFVHKLKMHTMATVSLLRNR